MDEKYIQDLWEWTTNQDPTFTQRYTFDSWKNKLESNSQYREDFHNWVSSVDSTFPERRPFNDWSNLVSSQSADIPTQVDEQPLKKKDVTESVSADGLSEQQKTTDFLDYSQMVSSPIMQDAATRPLVAEEDVPTTTEELTQTLSTAQRQGGQRYVEIDGEYIDLLHPDGDKRRKNIDRYQEYLSSPMKKGIPTISVGESKGYVLPSITAPIPSKTKEQKQKDEAEGKRVSKVKRFTENEKVEYDSYNPLVNASSTPLKASQQKGYLPGNVESIPRAADIVSGRMKPVVPFDMEAYNRDKELYAMMYDAEVETYKDYLKDKADYVRAADGRYYNPENFNAGEIFNNKINKLVNQELIEKEEEAVSMMLSDELSPFGFKVDKTGTFTDRIIVTAPNGQRQEFSLNNFFDDTDFNESVRLKAFLKRQYAKELTGGNIPRDIYGKELSLLDIDVSPQQNADIINKLTSSERRALDLDRERVVAGQSQLIYESDKEINNLNAQLEDTNKKIAEAEKLPESYKEWRGNVEVTVKNQERADRLQFLNKKKSALEKEIDDASFENRRLKKDKPINPVYKEFFSDNLDAQIQTDTEVLNEENRRHIYLVDLFKEKEDAFLEAEKQALALAEQSFDKKTQTWKSEEAERDYNKLTNVLENEKILLNKYGEKLLNEDIRLKIKDEQLTRDVGRKAAIQAEIGELGDSIVSAIVSGAGAVIEGGTEEFAGNIIRNINNMFYDETDEEYITDEEMNDLKKQSSIKKDWVDSYGSWADLTPEAMQAFRESLGVASIGFYGALESSPAMLLSLIPGGRALAPLGFSFLSAQNLREQMDNNPDFDYMSENDKLKFIAPMAFTIGLLENYGVRNVMRNSSFLGKTAAKLAGKGPTSKTLNEISDDLGKNYFQREVRKYVTTGLGELETEAMQEALDIYGKEYMDLKMKNNFWDQDVRFFKDEKGDVNYFSKAALSQIIESGMAGFFGGLTMKAPSTIANAVKGNKVEEIDDFTFMFYEAGMESPTIANAQRAQINNDIASGKITKEQGDDMWNTYTRTVGQMREVKKVAGQYDTNTKKKLLSLLMEKKQLEEKIDGVDKSLTREEQRKIKVAEERIQETLASGETKLTEDKAAYEQAKKDGYKGTFEQHRNGVKIKEVAEQAVEQEVKKKKPVKKAPIKEEKPVEAPAVEETTEEAPVTEEERAKMREVLGEPAAKEQAVEAPSLLNKEQREKYLKLSKEERDALDEIINDEELERSIGAKEQPESEQIEIEDEMFPVSSTISFEDMINQSLGIKPKKQKADGELFIFGRDVYDIDAATKLAEQDNVNVVDIPVGTLPKMRQPLVTKTERGIENADLSKPVIIATTNKGLLLIDGHHRLEKAIRDGKPVKAQILSENQTKNIKTQEQVVEKAPVKEAPKRKRRRKKPVVQEAPVKKAPKKTTKKKAPVKEEPQVSEEVQKEIDRAERLRDRIVAEKANKLSKAKGFEQKEEIRDEIRQAEKKYNNIITELKEGKRTRFRLSDDAKVETEEGFITEDAIVEVMKGLGSAEANFKIPVGEKQIEVDPIALSKSLKKITDAQAKKLGFKSVADMLKNIEEFNGIPMVVAMSDVLAAGTVKDSMGNDMEVGGGLLYNVLGPNKTLAWAGVNKDGANTQFEEAKAMYRANKELFDRLWKEGKLPKNHVPMVVVRMDNAAINSNEAMFRFMAPKLKSFPKKVQKIAFDTFLNQLESKKKTKSVEPALIEAFIKKNKIKDLGTLFDLIVEDAKKRAKGNEDTFPLTTKSYVLDMIASPVGVKKASKPVAKAIMNATDYNGEIFLIDHILSKIGETSMVEGERGDAVAIMGVDVSKNGGVTKAKHNNYGFGPKGRLIALIKNPTNVLQIFPEWRTKAFKMFEVKPSTGKMKTDAQVLADVYGQVFGDKAFRGSRLTKEMSDIDMVSAQMRFAFPSVSVSQSQQEFDEVLKQEGIRTAEANGNTILGLTKDGKIFLNPSRKSLSTPIHEFGHIWIDYLRSEESGSKGSKLLDRGLELVEGTKALESAIKKYGDNALAREEALVELMGTKGETIANAAKRAKFVEWFNAFFKYIKEKLTRFADIKAKDIKDITLEDFVDIGLAELFSGEAVDAKFKPEEAAESVKARMQKANIKPSMSAQNIIKKARAAEEPIRDAVIIDYLMSEKKLTRKQAISALKRANRGDLKDAVKRLFNNVEDITDIKEKDAQLIKDILKFDRSITRADKIAQKKIKDEIKIRLKAIQRKSKGKLSQAQLLAVTNRFANVNLSSEKSIDSFVDYMQKVFSDVDYAAKMTSLNKSITDAKTNINSKIGRGADGLAYELRRLLNISPTIIPDSVLEEYSDLVTSFGERKTVLKLKDSVEVKETIAKIFTELENQNSKLGELTERFEAFDDKKFTKTGTVSFSETVAQMVKDKVITEGEAKLMRKFKSDIMPIEKAEGKTEEDKQKEMEEEKKNLIENIKKSPVDVQRIELAIEKALVKDFARLIKTDAVNDLNNAQLKNIEKAIDNINNGYVTHYVLLASENLESINRSKMGAEGIRDAKPLAVSTQIAKIKTLYRSGSDANKFYKLIERNPLVNIDMVLGDFSSKRVFNSVLEESAEAVATFNTELNKVYKRIDEAEIMLQKKFEYNGNKILESKYKQMAYMVQQEFESNPNNPQVNPAAAVIKETIKKLRDSNQNYEAKILEKILKDYSTDGEIDLKKLDDSFVYAELNMIKVVQDINSKLTDKATYTASVIRGESIEPLNDYIHQSVLNTDGVAVDDSRALSESYMENIKPSTKAKNLIERTKGAKAINFDITASVRRGAKMTLMDYHLTSAFRTANRTLNKMEEQLEDEGQQRQIFLAVRDAYNQAISDVLENTFTSSSISEQIFQYAAKQGYRSMLASIPRVFGELLSNYAFALTNPVEFTEGSKPKNMKVAFSERGIEVMNNVRSKETARVYGEGLSGRFVETSMIEKKMGLAADAAKNPVVNRLNQGLSYLKKYPRGVEFIADFMITTPDKLVTRPMWFGSFATEFKKITGQEVNFDKIAENDAEYMEKFEKAINQAKKKADANSVLIGATDNPLQGILKNKKRASDKASIIKTINSFMQRFLLFEYNAFRKGMYASIGRGDISPGKGLLLMLAVSARMTMYTVMIPILNSLMFGDDEEEEEESTYTRVYRALLSTATNIMIGRDFGAIVKMIQNMFIEKANKDFGEDFGIREGEYDPFKNQVQYNIIPPEKPWKETSFIQDVVPNLIGPYSPLVKSITFGIDKYFFAKPKEEDEAKERQRREKYQRIPLEIGGLTGLVPFYRDLRKYLNEDIYKGLRAKDSKGESESKAEQEKKKKAFALRKKKRKRRNK